MYDPINDKGAEMPNQSTMMSSIVPVVARQLRCGSDICLDIPNGTAPEEPADSRKMFSRNTIANTSLDTQ